MKRATTILNSWIFININEYVNMRISDFGIFVCLGYLHHFLEASYTFAIMHLMLRQSETKTWTWYGQYKLKKQCCDFNP